MLSMQELEYRIWGMGMGHTEYGKKQKVKWKEEFGGTVREGPRNVEQGKDNS